MSPILASAIALLICAAFMIPAVWMGWSPGSARFLAPFSAALTVTVAIIQTGTFNRSSLKDVTQTIPADTAGSRCRQLMSLMMKDSILLQQPGPEGLVVRGELWDQFPQPVKQVVLVCAQNATNADGPDHVKVIRR